MTTATPTPSTAASLKANRLPVWAPYLVGAVALAVAYLLIYQGKQLGGGVAMTVIAAVVLFLILLAVTSRIVEGPRAARNRVMTTTIYTAFVLAALPLISVAQTLIRNGVFRIDG